MTERSIDPSCLPDPQSAAACPCTCHPRPGSPLVHDGGLSCSCQLTPAQRSQRWAEARASLSSWAASTRQAEENDLRLARREAERLDAQALSYGGLCPLVVRLTVDGHGAYLRARHDMYQVAVSTSDDPWQDGSGEIIAEGAEASLWASGTTWVDPRLAVRAVVSAVRRWLVRDCDHAEATTRFCPDCGTALDPRFGG